MSPSDQRIAITGTGIRLPMADHPDEFVQGLVNGASGIIPYFGNGSEPMRSKYAAIHKFFQLNEKYPKQCREWWDRATQMAAVAATQAVNSAKLLETSIPRERIGLAVGVSGAGQFSPNRDLHWDSIEWTLEIAELLFRRNVPHFQLFQIARWLQLSGPMTCVCSASAGSGIAIGAAMRWLLSHQADAVVAGGAEAVMLLNFLGFDTLGLLSETPCSPFSRSDGMTMGEGAAYLVLERWEDAIQRKAEIHGVLTGFCVTSDAFDPILYDPTGDGIRRAMQGAIADSQLNPLDIEWIRASGAGGRDQDASEIQAIRATFEESLPVVTSTEGQTGHCNGAGPAIGLVAAVESQRAGWIPQTLNFHEQTHQGIDFSPKQSKRKIASAFLSTTAAFGGTNVVLAGAAKSQPIPIRPFDEIVISGMGIVSGFGCSGNQFVDQLANATTFVGPIDRKQAKIEGVSNAALVRNFSFRKECPFVNARGVDLLTQYSAAAASRALQESQSHGNKFNSERLGVVTGISHPSGTLTVKLLEESRGNWATPTMGRILLNKGRFLVTSRIAHWLDCKGYNATIACGMGSGLTALNQAYEQLRQSPDLDAIVVVSSDEVCKLNLQLTSILGWLSNHDWPMLPTSDVCRGMILGEGAVAIVLERRSSLLQRGGKALCSLAGGTSALDSFPFSCSFRDQSSLGLQQREEGKGLETAIRNSLSLCGLQPEDVDLVLTQALALPEVDERQGRAIQRNFPNSISHGTASNLTGVLLSSGSLFHVALAASAIHDPNAYETINRIALASGKRLVAPPRCAAILSTSEDGLQVATILRQTHVLDDAPLTDS